MTLTHDEMLGMRLDGRPEESLRMALAFLSENGSDLTAWYVAVSLCAELGEAKTGIFGLSGVGEEYAENGNLPMALVCIREMDESGGDSSDLRGLVTILYGKGSARVKDRVLPPPPLPSAVEDSKLENFRPEKRFLVGEADRIMAAATESAKLGRTMSDRHPAVPYFPMFGALGPDGFLRLLDAFRIHRFLPDDRLMEQGKPSDELYLLARGEVSVHMTLKGGKRKDLAVLGPGSLLGEMGMVARTPRSANVEARTGGIALVASIDEIEKIAADHPEVADVIVMFCEIRLLENLMSVSPILNPIPPAERAQVVKMFDRLYVDTGQVVIHEGEAGKGIWLVVSGEMAVVREPEAQAGKKRMTDLTYLSTLKAGDVFGEISTVMNKPTTATVQAVSGAALLFLPRERFMDLTRGYPAVFQKIYEISRERESDIARMEETKASPAGDDVED